MPWFRSGSDTVSFLQEQKCKWMHMAYCAISAFNANTPQVSQQPAKPVTTSQRISLWIPPPSKLRAVSKNRRSLPVNRVTRQVADKNAFPLSSASQTTPPISLGCQQRGSGRGETRRGSGESLPCHVTWLERVPCEQQVSRNLSRGINCWWTAIGSQ